MTVITAIATTKGETSNATSQLQLPSGSSALTQMQTASMELSVAAQAALFTVRKRKCDARPRNTGSRNRTMTGFMWQARYDAMPALIRGTGCR